MGPRANFLCPSCNVKHELLIKSSACPTCGGPTTRLYDAINVATSGKLQFMRKIENSVEPQINAQAAVKDAKTRLAKQQTEAAERVAEQVAMSPRNQYSTPTNNHVGAAALGAVGPIARSSAQGLSYSLFGRPNQGLGTRRAMPGFVPNPVR